MVLRGNRTGKPFGRFWEDTTRIVHLLRNMFHFPLLGQGNLTMNKRLFGAGGVSANVPEMVFLLASLLSHPKHRFHFFLRKINKTSHPCVVEKNPKQMKQILRDRGAEAHGLGPLLGAEGALLGAPRAEAIESHGVDFQGPFGNHGGTN